MKKRKTFTRFALGGSLDKSSADTLTGERYESCYCQDGVLRAGMGLIPYTDANGNMVVLESRMGRVSNIFTLCVTAGGIVTEYLAVFKNEGEMYYYNPALNSNQGGWTFCYDFKTETKVIPTLDETGKPRTYFCNNNGIFYYISSYCVTHVVKAKPIGCFFEGRLFVAVSDTKIVFSLPYVLTAYTDSLTDSGHVLLPNDSGAICAIVPFQNKLYIFCEYGILEMTAVGNAQDFTLKRLEYNWGKIFGDSVAVCTSNTEGIYFLTENGICVFDGKSVKRTCKNVKIEAMVDGQHCTHAEYNGRYHVCFFNQYGVEKSVILNTETGEGYYSFPLRGIGATKKQGYCMLDGFIYRFDESGSMPGNRKRSFTVTGIDLDGDKEKSIQKMTVRGMGEVMISLYDGIERRTFTGTLDGGVYTFDVYMRTKNLNMLIELVAGTYIESVAFDYELLG